MRSVVRTGIERLVGAHIDSADGDGQAVHVLHGTLVSGKLFFLVRQMAAAPHEQKFAAKKAYTQGAGFERHLRILGHFDVG